MAQDPGRLREGSRRVGEWDGTGMLRLGGRDETPSDLGSDTYTCQSLASHRHLLFFGIHFLGLS